MRLALVAARLSPLPSAGMIHPACFGRPGKGRNAALSFEIYSTDGAEDQEA